MKNSFGYKKIKGTINVPGDKSISHRAVMLAGIAEGKSHIKGFLGSDDCRSTIGCFRSLGIEITEEKGLIAVQGRGLRGLQKPEAVLDAGNSGTTMRLLSGILAGQRFQSTITGDESLRKRPMSRIIAPLREMGADIEGVNGCAPLSIRGGNLKGIEYRLPVPSAQVKSAVLLAGLYAEGATRVIEETASRNHTEIMLRCFGAEVNCSGSTIQLLPSRLESQDITVPGDISSAAFFIAAAAALPGSELMAKGVGINPTRTGIVDVLLEMGADIRYENINTLCGEPIADIVVHGRQLHGVRVPGEIIPRLIDEVPVLAAVAAFAEGRTVIEGAAELKVKESDRIAAMASQLDKLGVRVRELEDGLELVGPNTIRGAEVESFGDHRIAMAMAVCGLFTDEAVNIKGREAVSISYPGFFETLAEVVK
jgi:3-phosphoshikimate 1-carboxyvinyltransferase